MTRIYTLHFVVRRLHYTGSELCMMKVGVEDESVPLPPSNNF